MKIVLSGSKKFIPKFFELEKQLTNMGHQVVVPREFMVEMEKRDASLLHFSEIQKDDVDCLLIVNESKNGFENYIGANGFAEIAFGFYFQKKVYLLNDIYEPYREELEAWSIIPLKGNLSVFETKQKEAKSK